MGEYNIFGRTALGGNIFWSATLSVVPAHGTKVVIVKPPEGLPTLVSQPIIRPSDTKQDDVSVAEVHFCQKHSLYIAANTFRGVRSIDHIFPLRFRWGFRLPSQQCDALFQRVNVLFFCDSRESPADILSFCSPTPPSSIDRNLSTTFRLGRCTRRYPDYRTRVRFFAPCRFLYVSL